MKQIVAAANTVVPAFLALEALGFLLEVTTASAQPAGPPAMARATSPTTPSPSSGSSGSSSSVAGTGPRPMPRSMRRFSASHSGGSQELILLGSQDGPAIRNRLRPLAVGARLPWWHRWLPTRTPDTVPVGGSTHLDLLPNDRRS